MPRPRVNLTRFHGVFAPNSRWRAQITPAGRGKQGIAEKHKSKPRQHVALSWAQRLKRVFRIDVETCEFCGGAVKIIASIEDPVVIAKILEHLKRRDSNPPTPHAPRAPPEASPAGPMD